jgi:hypothetical protein
MLRIVVVNIGDETGFPSQPVEVQHVLPMNLGKVVQARRGAVTLIIDDSVKVPHPYASDAELGLDRVQRMVNHAFFSIKREREGLEAVNHRHQVQDSIKEYNERLAREREQKEPA